MDGILAELKAIFPQHDQQVILKIFEEVSGNVGVENQEVVLDSCIEQLLEQPSQPQVPSAQHSPSILENNDSNDSLEGLNLPQVSKSAQHSPSILQNNNSNDSLEGLNLPQVSKSVQHSPSILDYNDSSDDELLTYSSNTYRNRKVSSTINKNTIDSANKDNNIFKNEIEKHTYRDKQNSASNSPSLFLDSEDDLFTSQEVLVLENISTKPEMVKHNIYDKDDISIIETDESMNIEIDEAMIYIRNPVNKENRKRKFSISNKDETPNKRHPHITINSDSSTPIIQNGGHIEKVKNYKKTNERLHHRNNDSVIRNATVIDPLDIAVSQSIRNLSNNNNTIHNDRFVNFMNKYKYAIPGNASADMESFVPVPIQTNATSTVTNNKSNILPMKPFESRSTSTVTINNTKFVPQKESIQNKNVQTVEEIYNDIVKGVNETHQTSVIQVNQAKFVPLKESIRNKNVQTVDEIYNDLVKGVNQVNQTRVIQVNQAVTKLTHPLPNTIPNSLPNIIGTFKPSSSTKTTCKIVTSPLSVASSSKESIPVIAKLKEIQKPVEIDVSQLEYGSPGFVDHAVKQIKNIIEDVDPNHLRSLIENYERPYKLHEVVERIVTSLLDDKSYPKEVKKPNLSTSTLSMKNNEKSSNEISPAKTLVYRNQVKQMLQNKFDTISTNTINMLLKKHWNYEKCSKALETALEKQKSGQKADIHVMFMKKARKSIRIQNVDHQLQSELDKMESEKKNNLEKNDHAAAIKINTDQYEAEGQAIECGCCYLESAFEDMVQCDEGHLFCSECLHRYSKEAVYGEGKAQLYCMTDGCDGIFFISQLQKALPDNIMEKFFERQQEENIKLANLENLVRCPSCDYAAELSEGDKVFKCQNQICLKETCRYCQEEWAEHFGLKCSEIEKKSVTSLRTSYEEKMTQAKVRTCWQCKTIFLKSDGCNKMTCRCGAKMCYICRHPKIDYGHFCQHLREPGQGCTQCKKCSLWTDPAEDDNRAVAEIQKEAEKEKEKLIDSNAPQAATNLKIGPEIKIKSPPKKKPPPPIHQLHANNIHHNIHHNIHRHIQHHAFHNRHGNGHQ